MAVGRSIHIGLNAVNPDHYRGWDGVLGACEFDARDMAGIADSQGFQSRNLLTQAATASAVTEAIGEAARATGPSDFLLVTFSGHGGQLPDLTSDEPDSRDETWCLFDRELLDDELGVLWALCPAGARILLISDSCHSGTVARFIMPDLERDPAAAFYKPAGSKGMPELLERLVYVEHRDLYDGIRDRTPDAADIAASLILLSGCQDHELSYDGERNGVFTGGLRAVWDDARFTGDYPTFHRAIVEHVGRGQTPNIGYVGEPSPVFKSQRPFVID